MSSDKHRGKLRRNLVLTGAFLVLSLFAFTAWQALQARSALLAVAGQVAPLHQALLDGDTAGSSQQLVTLRADAERAHRNTRGPLWWLGERMPWLGDDVTAVRVVADISHHLADGTLPALVDIAEQLDGGALTPQGGAVDLDVVEEIAPTLQTASDALTADAGRAEEIRPDGLLAALRQPVRDLQRQLASTSTTVQRAVTAASLMPDMLGAHGKRNYLVIFQNNAELRALGGMPGAMALVEADSGRLKMKFQGRPADIGTFPEPFVKLSGEERELYTMRPAVFPQDTVLMPEFPRAADVLKQMWERRRPERIDGVVSIDPVALSYLLRGVGPVEVAGQRLTSSNAVGVLMRDVYAQLPTDEEQNAFFNATAHVVFEKLVQGEQDPVALLGGLVQASEERRLMVWSSHRKDQERIRATAIAGTLTASDEERPVVGVFLNDSAPDKLGYYLDYDVNVTPRSCSSAGVQTLDVTVTLRSRVPAQAPLSLSVLGPGVPGKDPRAIRTSVSLYTPVGGAIREALLDGEESPMAEYVLGGRAVGAVTLDNHPGQSRVLTYEIRTAAGQRGAPLLLSTPTASSTGVGVVGGSAC